MDSDKKRKRYERIRGQLEEHLKVTGNRVSRMATIASLLYHKMDKYFWCGFYELVDGELLVGPYQGFLACQKLPENTGVCWAGVTEKKTIIVPDVNKFDGHIACDSRSKSEIVVPCFDEDGNVFAVLDVDSSEYNSFDEVDGEELEKIVRLI
jgi:GAF domain-containing protein